MDEQDTTGQAPAAVVAALDETLAEIDAKAGDEDTVTRARAGVAALYAVASGEGDVTGEGAGVDMMAARQDVEAALDMLAPPPGYSPGHYERIPAGGGRYWLGVWLPGIVSTSDLDTDCIRWAALIEQRDMGRLAQAIRPLVEALHRAHTEAAGERQRAEGHREELERLAAHLATLPVACAPVPPGERRSPVMGGECARCLAPAPYHEAVCARRVVSFTVARLDAMGVPPAEMATTTGEEPATMPPCGGCGETPPEGMPPAGLRRTAEGWRCYTCAPEAAERLAVAVLVTDPTGRVLLVRSRKAGRGWEMPGGGVEEWETPLEAAYREVREETGIAVIVEPSVIADLPGVPRDGVTNPRRCLVYRAAGEGEPRAGGDAEEARWVNAALVLDAHANGRLSPLASLSVLLAWAREQVAP